MGNYLRDKMHLRFENKYIPHAALCAMYLLSHAQDMIYASTAPIAFPVETVEGECDITMG